MITSSNLEFQHIYEKLSSILAGYARDSLSLKPKGTDQVELVGPPTQSSKGREVWFGAVRIGKRYVSYHLMPVYACPDLLNGISPQLKKRMQGKSCFNFTHIDDELFQELATLTENGYKRFKEKGLVK